MVLFLFGTNIQTVFATEGLPTTIAEVTADPQWGIQDSPNVGGDSDIIIYTRGSRQPIGQGNYAWRATAGAPRISCSRSTGVCQEYVPPQGIVGQIGQTISDTAFKGVMWFFIGLFYIAMWLLGIAGSLLEFIIREFVLGMSNFVGKEGYISIALVSAWSAIRDIANIAFIGGLVWASITMILNIAPTQGGKSSDLIIKLLVAALLVNFSFFFAGLIVDASNFVSGEIYEAGIGELTAAEETAPLVEGFPGSGTISGIGSLFMEKTQLSSVLSPEALSAEDPSLSVLFTAVLGIALFGTTAYVFFFGAFLLLTRFVILVLLLITSPLGVLRFMGIPEIEKWGKEWWDALITQSLFAPIFFLLIGISFRVISESQGYITSFGVASYSSLATENYQQAMGLLAIFAVSIGFVWASLVIARDISQKAARFKGLHDFSGGIAKGVMGGTFGALGTMALSRTAQGASYLQDRVPPPLQFLTGGRKAAAALKSVSDKKFFGAPESHNEAKNNAATREYELRAMKPSKSRIITSDEDAAEAMITISQMANKKKLSEEEQLQINDMVQSLRPQELKELLQNQDLSEKQRDVIGHAATGKKVLEARESTDGKNTPKSSQSLDGDSRIADAVSGTNTTTSVQPLEPGFSDLAELRGVLHSIERSTTQEAKEASRANLLQLRDQKREMLENKSIIKALDSSEYKTLKDSMAVSNRDTDTMDTLRYSELADHAKNGNEAGVKDSLKKVGGEELPPELAKHELVVKVQQDMKVSPAGAITPKTPPPGLSTAQRRRRKRKGK